MGSSVANYPRRPGPAAFDLKGLHMHLRALAGIVVACLAALAFAPVAMADPAPEICVLSIAEPVSFDLAGPIDPALCIAVPAEPKIAGLSTTGSRDIAAGVDCETLVAHLDLRWPRLHEDPGRCSA